MFSAAVQYSFLYVLTAVAVLILPAVCLAYLLYRLPARRDQLTTLFKSDGILPKYLTARGHLPPRHQGEPAAEYHQRLSLEFDRVFSLELKQEYGRTLYGVPIFAASVTTAVVTFYLVGEASGTHLIQQVPAPVRYALLGGFVGSLYNIITRYSLTDLSPVSLWWVPFRYFMAIAYGSFASMIFNDTFASLGAFMLGMIPITEALNFVRSRLVTFGLAPTNDQSSGFRLIQGLDAATIDTLVDLGISNTQLLAYSDPLKLLLRSNFSPSQLIDWMDQCFLFNYVGSKNEALRSVGLRGGIEVASLKDLDDIKRGGMIESLASRLNITPVEAENLVEDFWDDSQLDLIWEIWGS